MTKWLARRRGLDEKVYSPAEDSALLAETALSQIDDSPTVLDLGTGSGYIASKIQSSSDAWVIASDINPHACRTVARLGIDCIRANLLEPFQDNSIDIVVFNPPYLPTDPESSWDDWMERALDGGPTGRSVIDPFIDTVGRVLSPGGFVLLLISSLTGFDHIIDHCTRVGFSVVALRDESYPFETLTVLKLIP